MSLIQQLHRMGTAQGIALREQFRVLNKERQTLVIKDCRGLLSGAEKVRLRILDRKVDALHNRLYPVDLSHLEALVAERQRLAKRVQRYLLKTQRMLADHAVGGTSQDVP